MNVRSRTRLLCFVAALLVVAGGCRLATDRMPERPDPLPDEAGAHAVERGAPAADALAEAIFAGLTGAIDEQGMAGALAFCSEAALPLTEEAQDAYDPDLALKRTSLRWRNPVNAPDPWEERVLLYLERLERLDASLVPGEMAARGPDGSLRYYRVLQAAPMCLHCHGEVASMAVDVRQEIRARYPGDRATGYRAGQVRGVIRVQIPPDTAPGP